MTRRLSAHLVFVLLFGAGLAARGDEAQPKTLEDLAAGALAASPDDFVAGVIEMEAACEIHLEGDLCLDRYRLVEVIAQHGTARRPRHAGDDLYLTAVDDARRRPAGWMSRERYLALLIPSMLTADREAYDARMLSTRAHTRAGMPGAPDARCP